MSDTKIEWADKVLNLVTGCTQVSEGCRNCYARRMAYRLKGRFGYPADDPFRVTFHPERLEEPLKWKKPKRIFICSMGDLFHPQVLMDWKEKIYQVIEQCPQHTFLFLTKRPENVANFWFADPPKNLWLGVTVELQKYDWRIAELLKIPAAVHFVSIEPMLGPMAILGYLVGAHSFSTNILKWVILGGETGPGARPMDPAWARSVRDQCRKAGVPFFMKKLSGGKEPPVDLLIREFPNGCN